MRVVKEERLSGRAVVLQYHLQCGLSNLSLCELFEYVSDTYAVTGRGDHGSHLIKDQIASNVDLDVTPAHSKHPFVELSARVQPSVLVP